ncbi:hypothetical protein [Streptomyces sp. 5-10]|uniref:hypothetical protein n=1 Tax=Streptomyces sp. 5-10 TaxID=878925 RepID=UPI00168A73FE|nr:hypothetical protein [Streptomyces sp. 5-10]MBD3006378.1 hypothetical protein [Streptomyces sp. 5-10]
MRRLRTVMALVVMMVTAVVLGTAGASAGAASASRGDGLERVGVINGVTLYRGVTSSEQLAAVCDTNFCAYSSNTGEVAVARSCGLGFDVPSSWRVSPAGGWWQNNLSGAYVAMYNNSWVNIYNTPYPSSADWSANWAPVRYWETVCP